MTNCCIIIIEKAYTLYVITYSVVDLYITEHTACFR